MVLTTLKPSNKQFGPISQRYIRQRPSKANISELFSELVGRKINLADIRKYFELEHYKQDVDWYDWNSASTRKSLYAFVTVQAIVDRVQRLEKHGRSGTDIQLSYINQDAIEALLGEEGKKVLHKSLELICEIARKFRWALSKIELQCSSDIEVKNWNYVLLVLSFESDIDTANEYLNLLYGELDRLATTLTDEEQDILRRLIYFDVETTAIVSSS